MKPLDDMQNKKAMISKPTKLADGLEMEILLLRYTPMVGSSAGLKGHSTSLLIKNDYSINVS